MAVDPLNLGDIGTVSRPGTNLVILFLGEITFGRRKMRGDLVFVEDEDGAG